MLALAQKTSEPRVVANATNDLEASQRWCTCCERPLRGKFAWLELDQRTDTYHDRGGVPADRSQGWFPFGMTCARKKACGGHVMKSLPLNGTKTHPLSQHALSKLLSAARKPFPFQDLNPGVRDRLLREDLVEIVQLPSPFKAHRGATIAHVKIPDAGRAALVKAGYPNRAGAA